MAGANPFGPHEDLVETQAARRRFEAELAELAELAKLAAQEGGDPEPTPQTEAMIAVVRELLEFQVREIILQRRLLERIARAVEAREAPRVRNDFHVRPPQTKDGVNR